MHANGTETKEYQQILQFQIILASYVASYSCLAIFEFKNENLITDESRHSYSYFLYQR